LGYNNNSSIIKTFVFKWLDGLNGSLRPLHFQVYNSLYQSTAVYAKNHSQAFCTTFSVHSSFARFLDNQPHLGVQWGYKFSYGV